MQLSKTMITLLEEGVVIRSLNLKSSHEWLSCFVVRIWTRSCAQFALSSNTRRFHLKIKYGGITLFRKMGIERFAETAMHP
jgi:hypothetical protein